MELRLIKGLSDKRIADLKMMGINSAEELIRHFPKNYLDLRNEISIREAVHNDFALFKARIVGTPTLLKTKTRFNYVKAMCEQGGELFNVIWFNQPYVLSKLSPNTEYLFYGRVRNRFGQVSVTNPTFELVDSNLSLKGIVPVYRVKGCITQKIMRSVISDALNKVSIQSVLPQNSLLGENILSLSEAYKTVHSPQTFTLQREASERIALEEYYVLISAFKIIKGDKQQIRINRYNCSGAELKKFTSRFGFEFTAGQKQAVNDIFADMKGNNVMNRLLQGDVGSGKTAVALCAVYMSAVSGYQSVMLAPTEVLAKQNFELMKKYFPEFRIGFLSGSVSPKEKTAIKKAVKNGEYDIVCGTHAVLEKDVQFKNLSLCVCDEQQRFGVSQRTKLVEKGRATDVLVMSATPIPRTLSLIFYGDLDVSTIPDKPKRRQEVTTSIVPNFKYDDMLKFIQREVNDGRQAFFVCPKIEGDLEGSQMSVQEIYDEIKNKSPSLRCEILHGKMKDKEKTEIMQNFLEKKFDVLISTTVIEVGIDVPNATVMVIYGADRFGLSQLHQLRGRVGRSDLKSYCFLLSDNDSEKAMNRLKILKENSDGFNISERDFEERGSGDFMGTRQSGKFGGILGGLQYSTSVIFLAKKVSDHAFLSNENIRKIREIAFERYYSLKDVTLN
ncbi:MAG: helicase-related protein [Christensenellaceae bacterium]